MKKNRLEAFSDGVLAIIITIMILEMKKPEGSRLEDLEPVIPVFFSYVLSFIYIAIYWNNHHHMLHTVTKVTGGILWANMHLLFWLSLVPFVTDWIGEHNFAKVPMILYGIIFLMAALAYNILQQLIIKNHGSDSIIAKAIGNDFKGKVSLALYITAIVLCFFNPLYGGLIYILVALIWLVPDKRIENIYNDGSSKD